MSAAYPEGTTRYAVANILAKHREVTSEFIRARLLEQHTTGDIRYTMNGMFTAGLVEQNPNDGRYRFSEQGLRFWQQQQLAAEALKAPPPTPAAEKLEEPCPIYHSPELLRRGIVRQAGNTERLPMAYRPGAMDFKACARVVGLWRIHPDGHKERIHG